MKILISFYACSHLQMLCMSQEMHICTDNGQQSLAFQSLLNCRSRHSPQEQGSANSCLNIINFIQKCLEKVVRMMLHAVSLLILYGGKNLFLAIPYL